MSVDLDVFLQTLGWVSVIWLVAVEVLIRQGRVAADGLGFRVAGCAAAGSVLAASVAERLWPVAILGLLWLRTEVFGHRRQAAHERRRAELVAAEHAPVFVPGFGPFEAPNDLSGLTEVAPEGRAHLPHPHLPHPHLPHAQLPHIPHPHLTRRFVNLAFRIEMALVIAVASVFFLIWAQQQRELVGKDANHTVCHWLTQC